MSDVLTINTNIAISAPQSGMNVMKVAAADFEGAVTSAFNVNVPQIEKIVNEDLIGDGDEWGTDAENDYITHPSMTFSDRLNATQFAKLAKLFLSGTVTSTEVVASSGVYDHVIEFKASEADPQLEARSIAFVTGGIEFILADMVGNSLSIQASNGQAPTYSVDTMGSGLFAYPSAQSPALVLPTPVDQNYVGQASQSNVVFNDGTSFDMGSLGRIATFNLQASNNIITNDRRMGDPLKDSTDTNSGAYVRQMTRGKRTISVSVGMYVANDKRGYTAQLNNTTITSFSFISKGRKIAATIYRYEVEVIMPKSKIVATPLTDNNGKANMTLEFKPLRASGQVAPIKIRIRNNQTTLV